MTTDLHILVCTNLHRMLMIDGIFLGDPRFLVLRLLKQCVHNILRSNHQVATSCMYVKQSKLFIVVFMFIELVGHKYENKNLFR